MTVRQLINSGAGATIVSAPVLTRPGVDERMMTPALFSRVAPGTVNSQALVVVLARWSRPMMKSVSCTSICCMYDCIRSLIVSACN